MAGWGINNGDHWSAEKFDNYGFRRSDLKSFADKIGVNLEIPLEDIIANPTGNVNENPSQEDINHLKSKIASLEKHIEKLTSERPKSLGLYRADDPLLLAIEIRNREWASYDPDNDRMTRGNQAAIKQELEQRGFTSRQAESIELVACPIIRGRQT
ncbi:hypothetical protein [Citrobacter telavivensis]|uniref:hypothetical protein n=1 Tax=Citrobacter telavivensis TaxID=2653932 RepID=UPI00359D6B95